MQIDHPNTVLAANPQRRDCTRPSLPIYPMRILSPILLYAFLHNTFRIFAYEIVDNFSGATFFDKWDFYGHWDNLTLGDVWWLNRTQATDQKLAFINGAGNAVIKVDNASDVLWNEKRNTVRITTQSAYDLGSVWIADVLHMPYGCSVWPALWTMGTEWPYNGEIDIIEGINEVDRNQLSLHTRAGCMHTTPPGGQIGVSGEANCSAPSGCTVFEQKKFSYGRDFGASGGGVFAAQFDASGIYIWYWPRGLIPSSVYSAGPTSSMTLDDWGTPSATFPSTNTCNITQFFGPQKLVLDITLCGTWASLPELYAPQCNDSGPTGICYNDNVVGPGGRYDNAYFEIPYIRTYTTRAGMPPPTTATVTSNSASPTPGSSGSSSLDGGDDSISSAEWNGGQGQGALMVLSLVLALTVPSTLYLSL